MRRLSLGTVLGGAFVAVGILFAAIDSQILYRGWSAYGLDVWDKLSYGLAAASIPWIVAGYPFLWWIMWLRARWRAVLPLTIAGLVYIVLIVYSLIGAMGSIASVRGQVIAEKQSARESIDDLKGQRERLKEQLAGVPRHRPAGTVQALLQAEQAKALWEATDQCKEMYGSATRKYCTGIATLQGELESARKGDELTGKIEALSARIDNRAPVAEKADPMAATLALWLGKAGIAVKEQEASLGLPIATPAVLLIGEMFFVYAGLMLLGLDHRRLITAAEIPQQRSPAAVQREAVQGSLPPPSIPAEVVEERSTAVTLRGDPVTRGRELAVWFFAQCVRPVPAGGLTEERWYALYTEACSRSNSTPIDIEAFRALARDHGAYPVLIDGVWWYQRVLPLVPREGAA